MALTIGFGGCFGGCVGRQDAFERLACISGHAAQAEGLRDAAQAAKQAAK